MNNDKAVARSAGVTFFILAITGIFAEFFVRQKIYVHGDTVATASNILNQLDLFRLGIVSDLLMNTAFMIFGFLMYRLLKQVNEEYAKFMLHSVSIAVAFYFANMMNLVAALLTLDHSAYFNTFNTEQLHSLNAFFLDMHGHGYYIYQIFFGIYLLPLGWLICRSDFIPKFIGICLILGGLGDLIDVGRFFIVGDTKSIVLQNITIFADIGELSLMFYLLVVGVKKDWCG